MSRTGKTGRPPHADALTPAEWRVVEGVRHGLSNPALAARLGVSVDAVKFHVGNALGKLGFMNRAQLRRWDGVRKDSAMANTIGTQMDAVGLGLIGQIARASPDVERAAAWYADILGLSHLYSFGDLAFFDCGSVRLMLATGDMAANSIIYFRAKEIGSEHRRLADLGVEILAAPHRIHVHPDGSEEWMCFFRDLDGGTLALMATVGGDRA